MFADPCSRALRAYEEREWKTRGGFHGPGLGSAVCGFLHIALVRASHLTLPSSKEAGECSLPGAQKADEAGPAEPLALSRHTFPPWL